MAWTPVKDKGSVVKFHGGEMQICPCNASTGAAAGVWRQLPYFRECTISDSATSEPVIDGAGDTIATLEGTRTVQVKAKFLQRDKAFLDLVETRDQFYWLYVKTTKTNAISVGGTAKTQELFAAFAEVEPKIETDISGNSEIEIIFNLSRIDSSTTVSVVISSMAGSFTPAATSPVTIVGTAANPYYKVVES